MAETKPNEPVDPTRPIERDRPPAEVAAVFVIKHEDESIEIKCIPVSGDKTSVPYRCANTMASFFAIRSKMSPEAIEHLDNAIKHAILIDEMKKYPKIEEEKKA